MLKFIPRTVLMAAAFFTLVRLGGSWLANLLNNWKLFHDWLGSDIKTAAAGKSTVQLFEDVLQIGLFAAVIAALLTVVWFLARNNALGRRYSFWDLAGYLLSYLAFVCIADGAKLRPWELAFYFVAGLLAYRLRAGKEKPEEDDEEEKK